MGRRVLAPSDLAAGSGAGRKPSAAINRSLRVGGRVVAIDEGWLALADAYSTVRLRRPVLPPDVTISPGDFVVVDARRGRRHHEILRWVDHCPAPLPAAPGEFARLSWRGVGRLLQARAAAFVEIRRYFAAQGFLEVDTPVRVRVPGSDPHVTALSAEGGWLITSPEHHMKRLLAGGVPRLFQLARASRAEELGPWHEPEFVMLEWYRAFAEPEAVMRDTEQVVCRVFDALAPFRGRRGIRTPGIPFRRVTVADAFARWADVPDVFELAERDEDRYYALLVDRVEPALARSRRPVFLCDFPLAQAALARRAPHDPRVADRFELYFMGVELCNGYGELTDPDELTARHLEETARRRVAGETPYPLDEQLVAALREGMPPSAGNALGADRLVALAAGERSIARIQAFPRENA